MKRTYRNTTIVSINEVHSNGVFRVWDMHFFFLSIFLLCSKCGLVSNGVIRHTGLFLSFPMVAYFSNKKRRPRTDRQTDSQKSGGVCRCRIYSTCLGGFSPLVSHQCRRVVLSCLILTRAKSVFEIHVVQSRQNPIHSVPFFDRSPFFVPVYRLSGALVPVYQPTNQYVAERKAAQQLGEG